MRLYSITLLFIFQLSFTVGYAAEEKSEKEIEAEAAFKEFTQSEVKLKKAFLAKEQNFIRMWGAARDNGQLKELQASQQAWLKWRDLEASVQALEISEGGNLRGITETYRKTAMNLARIKRLMADGSELENDTEENQRHDANANNFADEIGDRLVDQAPSIYQGQLGQNNKGIFILYWLPNKKVRGAFFPENGKKCAQIYGYNKVNGEINLQIYIEKKLLCDGTLIKKKTKRNIGWGGTLKANSSELFVSMAKLNTAIPEGNSKSKAYTVLNGYDRKTFYLTFHKNDTVSGYAARTSDEDDEVYFSGVNYKNGYLFLEESGHFGDNEALVGAHLLLQKKKVQGSLIWIGQRFHHNGKVTEVSFGRTLK